MAFFKLSKTRALVDEIVHIRLQNLVDSAKVTLQSCLVHKGVSYSAFAYYHRDEVSKEVDLHRSRSIGGSYCGVEPMGLVWALQPNPGQKDGTRLLVRNASETTTLHLKAYPGHLPLQDLSQERSICEASFERTYLSDNVQRIPIRVGRLRGTLFVPQGYKSCPAVVDLFGAGGSIMEFRAALLASKGFITLSLPFFGYDDLPDKHIETDLTYFEEAVDWLLTYPGVTGNGVGLIGTSLGGNISLFMACHLGAKVKAVVSVNSWYDCGFHPLRYKDSYYEKTNNPPLAGLPSGEKGKIWRDYMESYRVEDCTPLEKADAPILFVLSGDDQSCPANIPHVLAERMTQAGKKNFTFIRYPGSGHLLEPPFAPLCKTTYMKMYDMLVDQGGNPIDHNLSQIAWWNDTQKFLYEHLGKPVVDHK